MSKKKKPIHIGTITSKQRFDWSKPKYNGHAIGTGIIGDTKYNRQQFTKESEEIIEEGYDNYDW